MRPARREPAVRRAEPLGYVAAAVAPQDVADSIAVEVAGAGHLPTRIGRTVAGMRFVGSKGPGGSAQPLGYIATAVAPEDVAAAVPIEVIGGGVQVGF